MQIHPVVHLKWCSSGSSRYIHIAYAICIWTDTQVMMMMMMMLKYLSFRYCYNLFFRIILFYFRKEETNNRTTKRTYGELIFAFIRNFVFLKADYENEFYFISFHFAEVYFFTSFSSSFRCRFISQKLLKLKIRSNSDGGWGENCAGLKASKT